MRLRQGVTLIEVLVAAVLLAVGIGGAMSAFVAATRLRLRADALESAAERAEERLRWFGRGSCPLRDTVLLVDSLAARERWTVRRDSTGATLRGRAVVRTFAGEERVVFAARRACE